VKRLSKHLVFPTSILQFWLLTKVVPHYRGYVANSNPIPAVLPWLSSPFPWDYRNKCPHCRISGYPGIPISMSMFNCFHTSEAYNSSGLTCYELSKRGISISCVETFALLTALLTCQDIVNLSSILYSNPQVSHFFCTVTLLRWPMERTAYLDWDIVRLQRNCPLSFCSRIMVLDRQISNWYYRQDVLLDQSLVLNCWVKDVKTFCHSIFSV